MDSMIIRGANRLLLFTAALAITYESTIEKGGRHRELAFRPDGTAMKAD